MWKHKKPEVTEEDESVIQNEKEEGHAPVGPSKSIRGLGTKDWTHVAEAVLSPSSETLPTIPQWNITVNGRKFAEYLQIASKKPRRSIFFLPTMDPTCKFATVWGYMTTGVDMTYTSFIVPLSLAFNNYYSLNAWTIFDLLGSIFYIVDFLTEFHIGFMVRWDMETVTIVDGIQIAKRYMLHGTGIIDFLAVLPIIVQVILVFSTDSRNRQVVQLLTLLRLLRLLRVVSLIMRMGQMGIGGSLSNTVASRMSTMSLFIIRIAFTLAVLVNLMACIWWWVAVTEGLDTSWVSTVVSTKVNLDLYTANDLERWLVSAYYVLCTISTIGYGDITPQTIAEVCVSMLFILAGVAYFGYVISSIGTLLEIMKSSGVDSVEILNKLKGMEVWMSKNGFSPEIRKEIRRYYYCIWSPRTEEKDVEYFQELPLWLRTKVVRSLMGKSLAVRRFVGIDLDSPSKVAKDIVKAISSSAVPMHLPSSQPLFEVNQDADYVYLLEEGEVGAVVPGSRLPYRITSPGVVGTAAMFSDEIVGCDKRLFTVFTITSCFVWRINAEDLWIRLLATTPIALLHILSGFISSVKDFKKHLENEGFDLSVLKSQLHMFGGFNILEESEHLRNFLTEASRRALQQDLEAGIIDSAAEARIRNILKKSTNQTTAEGEDDSITEPATSGPTTEDLVEGKPFVPILRRQRTIFERPSSEDPKNHAFI